MAAILDVIIFLALAQFTDRMDPMYIIPKEPPKRHDDAHIFYLFFWRPSWILLFLALAQHTDKIDPMYIIPKDPPERHDDACVICFLSVSNFDSGHLVLIFFGL